MKFKDMKVDTGLFEWFKLIDLFRMGLCIIHSAYKSIETVFSWVVHNNRTHCTIGNTIQQHVELIDATAVITFLFLESSLQKDLYQNNFPKSY